MASSTVRPLPWLLDHPWTVIAAAALVAFGVWVWGTRTQPHRVSVSFETALSLTPGLDVQVDGVDAGKIAKVGYEDGRAVVELGIDDEFWPLRRGATATIRFGTTIGNGTRRIDVDPGPASAPAVPDGGVIAGEAAVAPVEIDQVFNTLDRRSRRHLRGFLAGTGDALAPGAPDLNAGLSRSAPGLRAVRGVIAELVADERALRGLVANGGRAMRTVNGRREELRELVTVSAATMDTFARRTRSIEQAIGRLPGAMSDARSTLARVDGSVERLDGLVADLRPGAQRLGPLARDLRTALDRLTTSGPVATGTLRTLRRGGPQITGLLREGAPFLRRAGELLERSAPLLACVRPYAPEIAGTFTNWAGFTKNHDATAHYARVSATFSAMNPSIPPVTTADFLRVVPGIDYAFPRPPGYNSGQPWLLPECGVGPEALDPSKDPEDDRGGAPDQQEDTLPTTRGDRP